MAQPLHKSRSMRRITINLSIPILLVAGTFGACGDHGPTGETSDPVQSAAGTSLQPAPLDPAVLTALQQKEQDNITKGLAHVNRRPVGARHFNQAFLDEVARAKAEGRLAQLAAAGGREVQLPFGQRVQLQSDFLRLSEIGSSQRLLNDLGNLRRAYQLAWDLAPVAVRSRHPSPAVANTLSLSSLQSELRFIRRDFELPNDFNVPPGVLQPPTQAACQAELGYDTGADQNPGTCAAYATAGLMRNVPFALRDDLTCVRNQGKRGSCTAFGTLAAMETAVHVQNGNKINLSEQHAYWYGETVVDYFHRYTYGLNTADFLQELYDSGYQIPKEKIWNYNPSWSRGTKSGDIYPNSCVGYAETCTDFAFQGEEQVGWILGLPFFVHPNPAPNAGAWSVALAVEIGTLSGDLDWAKFALDNEVSFAVAVDVTDSFKNPDANGYVTYVANEEVLGGHALHVAGWVDNADLPTGAPTGSGGGYFVLKNSWGEYAGDCGYYYVPYDYLLEYGRSLTTVSVQ